MDRTEPIPFHIARAYGVAPIRPVTPASRVTGGGDPLRVAAGSLQREPTPVDRLVAAVVPGRVDFSGEVPMPAAGMPSLYRHPADRNAAATGIQAGRVLDVQG